MTRITALYKTERYELSVPVKDFADDFIDIPKFLGYCRECNNYNKVWSCPDYDFDPMDIWVKYKTLDLIVVKVIYDSRHNEEKYTRDELTQISANTLLKEKDKLLEELMSKEESYDDALSLAAGSCDICGRLEDNSVDCAKRIGEICKHPDKLRYSIESLGGDVVGAAKELFDIDLVWSEGDNLPEYLILMCGILKN